MEPLRNVSNGYFVEPYSFFTLDNEHKAGLIVLGALGMLSVTTLLPVIAFITIRLFIVPNITQNQPIILCFNLLLADLFQATSFLASFHWIVEAWTIVRGKSLSQKTFSAIILFIWAVAVALTIIGPIKYGRAFFVRAGNWCWISPAHETERLVCHYLWTFINEFGTIVIYALIFIFLSRKLSTLRKARPDLAAGKSISRATKYMILYPVVFVIATLPLAVGRMMSASRHTPSDQYFFGSGALLASCGWLDAVLYTFTRRVLLKGGPGDEGTDPHSSHGHRSTWLGFSNGGGTSPFRFSSNTAQERESKTMSGMTWEMPGKSPIRRGHQPEESDEIELVNSPGGAGDQAAHSRADTMDSSVNVPIQGGWPLPPAESPLPGDEPAEPVRRRTMVRIEEEPQPGRAPRKYWRMEPVQSVFE